MHKLKDLQIEKELLPLFNSSLNMFSRKKILELLESPLNTTTAILEREGLNKLLD